MAYSRTMLVFIFALVARFAFAQSPASSPAKSPTASPPDLQTPPPVFTSPPAQSTVRSAPQMLPPPPPTPTGSTTTITITNPNTIVVTNGGGGSTKTPSGVTSPPAQSTVIITILQMIGHIVMGGAAIVGMWFIVHCMIPVIIAALAAPPAGRFGRDLEMGRSDLNVGC